METVRRVWNLKCLTWNPGSSTSLLSQPCETSVARLCKIYILALSRLTLIMTSLPSMQTPASGFEGILLLIS